MILTVSTTVLASCCVLIESLRLSLLLLETKEEFLRTFSLFKSEKYLSQGSFFSQGNLVELHKLKQWNFRSLQLQKINANQHLHSKHHFNELFSEKLLFCCWKFLAAIGYLQKIVDQDLPLVYFWALSIILIMHLLFLITHWHSDLSFKLNTVGHFSLSQCSCCKEI